MKRITCAVVLATVVVVDRLPERCEFGILRIAPLEIFPLVLGIWHFQSSGWCLIWTSTVVRLAAVSEASVGSRCWRAKRLVNSLSTGPAKRGGLQSLHLSTTIELREP